MDYNTLNNLLTKVNEVRPLNPLATQKLAESLELEIIQSSNAIEGNTLTLQETFLVVNQGLTISGKSLREHLEAVSLKQAMGFLEEIVSQGETLTERLLLQLHQIVLHGNKEAGKYRVVSVRIGGSTHIPPASWDVPLRMKNLFSWYSANSKCMHPVELAAEFHHRLAYIHPFIDGNGRTARLCMNFILMQAGFPPIVVKGDDDSRRRYYAALEKADLGDLSDFEQLVYNQCKEMLELYVNVLTPHDMQSSSSFDIQS